MTDSKRRKPRPHQRGAIAAAIKHFKKSDKGRLIMACGSGKTLTALWIAEILKAKRILITVPSLNLSAQNLDQWQKEHIAMGKLTDFLCICSDRTVGDLKDENGELLLSTPVTTDPKILRKFVAGRDKFVIITTYASSMDIINALGDIDFCLTIHDEAHRTAGAENRHYSQLILDDNISTIKRLFMTATERVYNGHHNVISMDDEKLYGEKFYELDFRKAIRLGILCDYEIKLVHTNDDTIKRYLGKNHSVKDKNHGLDDKMRSVAAAVMLQKDFKSGRIHRCISFHNTIKNAQLFNNTIEKVSGRMIKSQHINGTMNASSRRHILTLFAENRNIVLTNSKTLTEGQDIPTLDAIAFCDQRNSIIDIAQSLGRAIRIDKFRPNKKAVVYIPIYELGKYTNMLRILRDLILIDSKLKASVATPATGGGGMISVRDDSKLINYDDIFKSIRAKTALRSSLPPPSLIEVEKYCEANGIKTLAQYIKLYKAGQLPIHFQQTIHQHPGYDKSSIFKESRSSFDLRDVSEVASLDDVKKYCKLKNIHSWREYVKAHKAGKLPKNFLRYLRRYPDYTSFEELMGNTKAVWDEVAKFVKSNDIRTIAEYNRWYKAGKLPENFRTNLYDYDEFTTDIFKSDFDLLTIEERFQTIARFCKDKKIIHLSDYKQWFADKRLPRGFPRDIERGVFKKLYIKNRIFVHKTKLIGAELNQLRAKFTVDGIKTYCLQHGIHLPAQLSALGREKKLPLGFPYQQKHIENFKGQDIRPLVFSKYQTSADYYLDYCKKRGIRNAAEYREAFHAGKLPISFKEKPVILAQSRYGFIPKGGKIINGKRSGKITLKKQN